MSVLLCQIYVLVIRLPFITVVCVCVCVRERERGSSLFR